MHEYLNIFGLHLPLYGLMILTGIVVANAVALLLCKKLQADKLELLLLESYGIIGAFIGSKLLFLIIGFREIDWARIGEFKYLINVITNGFVFYGGLIGAVLCIFLGAKIHQIDVWFYLRKFIFMIPMMHAFGRIGCFFAGCCYGRPYKGPGAVVFPEGSQALSGVKLFPVQLVEAVVVLLLAIVLLILIVKKSFFYTIETYLLAYSVIRFILEFMRYDAVRGEAFGLSTSQWISIAIFVGTIISIIYRKIKCIKRTTN
ncbi:MAG: prolipoprotein diacylglyceryl transferase [Eubacterium sp.]|nr:prolipoprotein diacylglyceryl transferase [Eubacterium sp.]